MAARQQYHDEAHERHDTEIKRILEAIYIDAENIRDLRDYGKTRNPRPHGRGSSMGLIDGAGKSPGRQAGGSRAPVY